MLSTAQLTDTQVIGAKAINETRFQYQHINNQGFGDNTLPAINVSQAFNGGGAQVGHNYDVEDHYELQNYTSYAAGKHAWKFGVRVRAVDLNSLSPNNFGGTYSFTGGYVPVLDANNQSVAPGVVCDPVAQSAGCQTAHLDPALSQNAAVPADGSEPGSRSGLWAAARPSSRISAGNPFAEVNQTDLGFFVQDDWRCAPI